MVIKLLVLIITFLVVIAVIILVIKRNHKDRKDLFKKLPEDSPDPKMVESEFDSVDK